MARRDWTRDELIVAINLYCKLPFGQLHQKNPRILELAKLLGRTPGSVAMKLVNFASLDPTHQQRGVSGLGNTSKADRQVWDEFNGNWADLAAESEKVYRTLTAKDLAPDAQDDTPDAPGRGETERQQVVKVRLGQSFFRETVLSAYGCRCCVCALRVEPLLVASHIIPWAARPCFWKNKIEANRFWKNKIEANRRRDADTDSRLAGAGWLVIRVWEHEKPLAAATRIAEVVRSRRATASHATF
jgi:hypothetical protein